MKKIRIDGLVELDSRVSTVGEELKKILNNMPCADAKTAAKQVLLAKELSEVISAEDQYFSFEEEFESVIGAALDVAATRMSAIVIAPLQVSMSKAEAFKGKDVKTEAGEPAPEGTPAEPETPAAE